LILPREEVKLMLIDDGFFPPQVLAFATGREIDFSKPKTAEAVLTDAQKGFLHPLIGHTDGFWGMQQVHGRRILTVGPGDPPVREEADGLLTRVKNFAIAVRTADCLPVFLFAPDAHGIGIVHAGWRGTRQQIVAHAIDRMHKEWNADPAKIRVAFGPAIRSCCYRVGPEFMDFFPNTVQARGEIQFFDMAAENRRQCLAAGVNANNIIDAGVCTHCEKSFFSYRREGDAAGRMISVIMLK
jgi:polyphenol oxidase